MFTLRSGFKFGILWKWFLKRTEPVQKWGELACHWHSWALMSRVTKCRNGGSVRGNTNRVRQHFSASSECGRTENRTVYSNISTSSWIIWRWEANKSCSTNNFGLLLQDVSRLLIMLPFSNVSSNLFWQSSDFSTRYNLMVQFFFLPFGTYSPFRSTSSFFRTNNFHIPFLNEVKFGCTSKWNHDK